MAKDLTLNLIGKENIKVPYSRTNETQKQINVLEDEYLMNGLSENTAKTYNCYLEKFFDFCGDSEINQEMGKLFLLERKKELAKKGKESDATLNTIRAALNFFFVEVLDLDTVDFPVSAPHSPVTSKDILTKDEIKALIKNAGSRETKWAMEVMLGGGLRLSETLALTYDCLNLDKLTVDVIKGKGKKNRTTLICPALAKELKEIKWNGKIFSITKRSLQESVKIAAKKAGIQKDVYPHLLRHCFGTYHYKQYKDLMALAKLMGHGSWEHPDITTTQIYVQLSGEDIKTDAKNLYN